MLDAFLHKDENIQQALGLIAEEIDAEEGIVHDKYMTPYLTKLAIVALTRLVNIPVLEAEVDAKDNTVMAVLRDGIATSFNTLNKLHIALIAAINAHAILTNNPHSLTKTQVGLSNLPNAKSDAITLNDSNTLVTSKAVKTLNDNKEPAFGRNTAFNKNFGSGNNDIPKGDHTHRVLVNNNITRVTAHNTGAIVNGELTVNNNIQSNKEIISRNFYELRPSGAALLARRTFFGRYSADDFSFIRVDKTDGVPNYGAFFQFKENGELQTSLVLAVTSGGNKTWDLIQSGNEFNFAGNGLTSTSCAINYRRSGSGTGTSQIEDYYFCKGYATSTTTLLSDVNAKDFNYYGGINNLSDERLKRNVIPLTGGARALIKQLSPILYLLHSPDDEGKTIPDRLGLIAQQVETIIPHAVKTHKNGIKSIDYSKLVIPLIKAFQEQENELDTSKQIYRQ